MLGPEEDGVLQSIAREQFKANDVARASLSKLLLVQVEEEDLPGRGVVDPEPFAPGIGLDDLIVFGLFMVSVFD